MHTTSTAKIKTRGVGRERNKHRHGPRRDVIFKEAILFTEACLKRCKKRRWRWWWRRRRRCGRPRIQNGCCRRDSLIERCRCVVLCLTAPCRKPERLRCTTRCAPLTRPRCTWWTSWCRTGEYWATFRFLLLFSYLSRTISHTFIYIPVNIIILASWHSLAFYVSC